MPLSLECISNLSMKNTLNYTDDRAIVQVTIKKLYEMRNDKKIKEEYKKEIH